MRILLVVDDLPDWRRVMRRLFESNAWTIVEARTLAEARAILLYGVQVDAIAVDWSFPGDDDGRPPARQVLALAAAGQPPEYRRIPCALVTGRQDLDALDVVGFDHVIMKIDAQLLVHLFEEISDGRPPLH